MTDRSARGRRSRSRSAVSLKCLHGKSTILPSLSVSFGEMRIILAHRFRLQHVQGSVQTLQFRLKKQHTPSTTIRFATKIPVLLGSLPGPYLGCSIRQTPHHRSIAIWWRDRWAPHHRVTNGNDHDHYILHWMVERYNITTREKRYRVHTVLRIGQVLLLYKRWGPAYRWRWSGSEIQIGYKDYRDVLTPKDNLWNDAKDRHVSLVLSFEEELPFHWPDDM